MIALFESRSSSKILAGFFYKQAAPPLGRKRFGDGHFYKQAVPLGLKSLRDGHFYKQAVPLGLKRFGDGHTTNITPHRWAEEILLETAYSLRRTTIGSTLVARRAGA
jgi:hypothetical protein